MRQCQIRARDVLIEDGMDADEAAEAVQPLLTAETHETDGESDKEDPGNPHKLRKCSISLKRIGYIENAVKGGFRSILFVSYKSGTIRKYIL